MIKQMEKRFILASTIVISLIFLVLIIALQLISSKMNIRKADLILSSVATETSVSILENNHSIESFRTFSITIANDEVIKVDGLTLQEDMAVDMAKEAMLSNDSYGFIDDFRYLVIASTDSTTIYFLDYSHERDSATSLFLISFIIYGFSVLLVYILVKVFMKFIMKPIKESYSKQKQFITDASHELKTPLTIISTNMQLIELETGESKWVNNTNKQVNRLTSLTNDLVDLSRMDEGDNKLIIKDINLSELVDDVVYGFEYALIAKGKKLEINIEDKIIICSNYESLEKVLSILMENALKYSDENALVTVDLFKKNKKTILMIKNTVDEIKIGKHNEFLERFYRGDKSRNSENIGFGIGLAVAKSIVEQHDGILEAYSEDTNSIVFKVEL